MRKKVNPIAYFLVILANGICCPSFFVVQCAVLSAPGAIPEPIFSLRTSKNRDRINPASLTRAGGVMEVRRWDRLLGVPCCGSKFKPWPVHRGFYFKFPSSNIRCAALESFGEGSNLTGTSFQAERSRMLRLIEADLASPGKPHLRNRAPACFLNARALDALFRQ